MSKVCFVVIGLAVSATSAQMPCPDDNRRAVTFEVAWEESNCYGMDFAYEADYELEQELLLWTQLANEGMCLNCYYINNGVWDEKCWESWTYWHYVASQTSLLLHWVKIKDETGPNGEPCDLLGFK